MDVAELILAGLAMALATVVQLSAGLGLGLVGVPLLAAIDPRLVPVPFVLSGLPMMLGQWRVDSGAVPPGMLAPALLGVVLGTAGGMALAILLPGIATRRGYGVIVLLAVALALAMPRLRPTRPMLAGAAAVSGVMGGISGVHGPLMGLVVAHLPAQAVRGFLGLFWLVAYGAILAAAVPAGRLGWQELWLALALLPGIALGAALSGPARRWLHGPRLRWAILGISGAGGIALVLAG
ncbi:TSUP family transporter [Roseomonas sp. SSH11]|uniref:Probable membrane transporter protein n=1 Tax=Pararoseomonas baculiformis TaxID=2820812 RepID=A0ABS4A8W2_9PROT|nr:TSUP family transporter [Pararoseomonas baculiformis]MBP0443445.1 TSUP family transporter [Pararoseomonas baculiformis]